jgi:hypothetical protein
MKTRIHTTINLLLPQPLVGLGAVVLALVALATAWRQAVATTLHGPSGNPTDIALSLCLVGAVVVSYRYPIHARHQLKVFLYTVAYFLLAALVPPPLAALAAGLGALTGELSRRASSGAYPSDIASEVGRRALMVLLGGMVAHAGGDAVPLSLTLLGAAAVMMIVDVVSLPLVVAPMSNDRPWRVLVTAARDAPLSEGVQYVVGLLGALAAQQRPWAIILLVVPAALVYISFKNMKEMHDGTRQFLENMADAVDLRDAYTGGHSRRVTEYCTVILKELGFNGPEVALIEAAARVHDIGKIGIPDAVLNKPGRLTDQERAIMEEHPAHGAALLKRYVDFARGVEIVLHHHESWDGAGYPRGLVGTEIPFGARVIAVADSYDAMTSDRPYRRGMSADKALAILRQGRGQQWDATIVDAFLRGVATVPPDQGDKYAAPHVQVVPTAVSEPTLMVAATDVA